MVKIFRPSLHAGWTRIAIALTGIAIAALWITGVVLYAWPSSDIAELDPARAEVRRWAVAIHGSVVWLALFFGGRWVWPHVATIWRRPRTNTWLVGLATLALFIVATVTGIALLYGPAALHDWTATGHWWCALAIPALVAWHAKGLVQRRRPDAIDEDSDWS